MGGGGGGYTSRLDGQYSESPYSTVLSKNNFTPPNRACIHKTNVRNCRSNYRVDFFASRLKSQLFPRIHCGIHEKGLKFGGFLKKVDSF